MSEKQKMDITAIEQALNDGLSTNVCEIYIPSIKRKVPFKPLLTSQCKTLGKMLIEADQKPFDTFKIVVGMIKSTCLDDTVDMNALTELDRIKIMFEFYIVNNILKDFQVQCDKCSTKNTIHLDLSGILKELESFDDTPIDFSNDSKNLLTCCLSVPKLTTMYSFYELVQNGTIDDDDLMKCFFSKVSLVFENKDITPIDVNIDDMELVDYLKVLDMIPYKIFNNINTDQSAFDIIIDQINNMMESDLPEYVCTECGEALGGIATAQNFI